MDLSKQIVVFSGFRSDELKKLIEERGGAVRTALSGTTTLLVFDPSGKKSSKPDEARQRGIMVMTIDEFQARLVQKSSPKKPDLKAMSYRELVALHKELVEKGTITKRKGMRMTHDAVLKRLEKKMS